jgi:phytoene dehydrogenase-like protein
MGTLKLDCALAAPPRFTAEALHDTGVFHLAESVETMSGAVNQALRGLLPEHPLIIGGVHTLADPSRAPEGQHTLWIETHVPHHIRGDAAGTIAATDWAQAREPFADRLLAELERYAPGVGALVLGRHAESPDDMQAGNSNLVGGDITGGSFFLDQQAIFRPFPGWFQHRTPLKGLYMSGASTHPGGGVQGAPGANAARVLLADLRLQQAGEAVSEGVDALATQASRLLRRLVH